MNQLKISGTFKEKNQFSSFVTSQTFEILHSNKHLHVYPLSHTHTQMCKYKYSHICMMANLLAIFMSSLSWWKNLLWVLLIAANKLCYIHSEKNSADWKLHLCRFSTVTGVRSLYFTPSLQLRVYHSTVQPLTPSPRAKKEQCVWDEIWTQEPDPLYSGNKMFSQPSTWWYNVLHYHTSNPYRK